jgi:hypothetical protein
MPAKRLSPSRNACPRNQIANVSKTIHSEKTHVMGLRLAGSFLALLFSVGGVAGAQSIADSINAGANPDGNAWFGAPTAGWNYTPTSSYLLSGVLTEFAALGPTGCNGLTCPTSVTVVV